MYGNKSFGVYFDEAAFDFLDEVSINGEPLEDEDDMSVDNEEENTDDTGTPDDQTMPETTEEDQAGAEDTPENANDAVTADEDFSIPEDDAPEADPVDAGEETVDDQTTDDTTEGGDEGNENYGDEETAGSDEDFSIEDSGDDIGGEESGEGTGDDMSGDTGSDTGDDSGLSGDAGSSDGGTYPGSEEENQIYDTLSDEQKRIRILELKLNFKSIYEEADAVINSVNNIAKDSDNIEPIKRIIDVLNNCKKYIVDYMANVFDNTSYMENNAVYMKYIGIFHKIKEIIQELGRKDK